MMRVCSMAGEIAVKMAVDTACWLVMNWVGEMVGQMAACWDERMVVMRFGSSVDKMAEGAASERAG